MVGVPQMVVISCDRYLYTGDRDTRMLAVFPPPGKQMSRPQESDMLREF